MPKTNFLNKVIFLWVVLLILGMSDLRTYAYQTATVYINPPEITGLTLGENFTINVSIANVSNLAGWEFRLYFISRVISVIDAQEGPFLKSITNTIFIKANVTNNYNTTHGFVYLACALLGSGYGAEGSGTLAAINFTVVGIGETPLCLPQNETKLRDSTPMGGQPIPHTTLDGLVRVGGIDIAVTNIKHYKSITNDTNVPIEVTVQNYGNYSATFDVTLYYNEYEIQTQTVRDLAPGGIKTLNITWDTTPVPKGNYTISAYAHPITGESNIENNLLIGGWIIETILGDVTGEGKVDILDIATIAKAYGAYPGHPKWNPNADLDNNNKIDIIDIAKAAKNYGKQI
jgi:hypothetical protein